MRTKTLLFVSVTFVLTTIISGKILAQNDLYMPRDIKKAYDNETRSYDGKPGKNYWQNYSNYKITVKVTPSSRLVEGEETIIYHNNSPEDLDRIVFRLYQNRNKIGAQRSRPLSKKAITDGQTITKMIIDGNEIDLKNKKKVLDRGTNLIVKLDSLIASKSSIEINVNWNFTIP
ncbi:MAG: M1 family peptidase, partial [Bacteroidetes bacterium]|nr:M1 family peptidase [Bacteroidota bacterium]